MSNLSPIDSIRNIVVVGESGVGKSSLINLITGTVCALAANDVRGVTAKTEPYDWSDAGWTFRLWDTPGLNEGSYGTTSSNRAQDAIQSLLTKLSEEDGIHLLVLSMRGTSVTSGMRKMYRITVDICNKVTSGVPLVAVITHLENRSTVPDILPSMESWLTDNATALSDYGMAFSDCACITTLPDHCSPVLLGRRRLCQERVRYLIINNVAPKLPRNVIIAGGMGVGKSSLVNLLLGSVRAGVDKFGTAKVTTDHYDWKVENQLFRLWDTPGLEGVTHGGGLNRHAWEVLKPFFSVPGGVHLLVICTSGISEIISGAKKTHNLIIKILPPTTPVVVVITGLEDWSSTTDSLDSMERWWTTNSEAILDVPCLGHSCITTLPDDHPPQVSGRRELCRNLVHNLIVNQSLPLWTPHRLKDLNILLFGEAGAGKSSLINLLLQNQTALTSSSTEPCTLDSQEYEFSQVGSTTIRLWDTVGLQIPGKSRDYVGPIQKAVQLVQKLNMSGGISLFLFCIRGSRISWEVAQSNYRLFYEVLGEKQVPIALAITHLENETNMEDWWKCNQQSLERNGIFSAAHVCITTLRDRYPKSAESRDVLLKLFSCFDDQVKFSMPSEDWIRRLLKGLISLLGKTLKEKELVRILTKRCHLDLDAAQRLATYILSDNGQPRSNSPHTNTTSSGEAL